MMLKRPPHPQAEADPLAALPVRWAPAAILGASSARPEPGAVRLLLLDPREGAAARWAPLLAQLPCAAQLCQSPAQLLDCVRQAPAQIALDLILWGDGRPNAALTAQICAAKRRPCAGLVRPLSWARSLGASSHDPQRLCAAVTRLVARWRRGELRAAHARQSTLRTLGRSQVRWPQGLTDGAQLDAVATSLDVRARLEALGASISLAHPPSVLGPRPRRRLRARRRGAPRHSIARPSEGALCLFTLPDHTPAVERALPGRERAELAAARRQLPAQVGPLRQLERQSFSHTVGALMDVLRQKDRYTAAHGQRVAVYAQATAHRLGLSARLCQVAYEAGRLHDIGKIILSDEILNKAGPLSAEEWRRFRTHPSVGKQILRRIPGFEVLLPAVACHHERWDGGGYPYGLRRTEIPLLARVMAVADSFDAMTSDRAYRPAQPILWALEELRRCAGSQFDPQVVAAFLSISEAQHAQAAARRACPLPHSLSAARR